MGPAFDSRLMQSFVPFLHTIPAIAVTVLVLFYRALFYRALFYRAAEFPQGSSRFVFLSY